MPQGRWANWQYVTKGKKGQQANKQPARKAWGAPAASPPRSPAPHGGQATPTAKQLVEWKARGWQDRSANASAKPVDPDDPVIPPVQRDPEQTARTDRIRQQHQDAVKVRDMVARSDTATPEVVAMHDNIVARLRAQLDDSKPVEDLYAGQLKKVKQLEEKVQQAETSATEEWAAVNTQVEVAKKADLKCRTLAQSLHDAKQSLPAMAEAAKATLPKQKHQRAFDDILHYVDGQAQVLADAKDAATASALKAMGEALAAVREQLAAINSAKATKDAQGDAVMGGGATATANTMPAATVEVQQPVPAQPTATGTGGNGPIDLTTQPSQADQPAPATGVDQALLHQQKTIMAKAEELSRSDERDTEELKTQRSALRGRMAGVPIDYDFLQKGITRLQTALQNQADADDTGTGQPASKVHRVSEELGDTPEDGNQDDL